MLELTRANLTELILDLFSVTLYGKIVIQRTLISQLGGEMRKR